MFNFTKRHFVPFHDIVYKKITTQTICVVVFYDPASAFVNKNTDKTTLSNQDNDKFREIYFD